MGQPTVTLYCDVSTDRIRPFVTEFFRQEIFNKLYALSHPGIRTSLKLVAERFVWSSMRQDITLRANTCLQCQHAKVSQHTRSEVGKFEPPSSQLEHVHIDLVGPPTSIRGFSLLPHLCGSVHQMARSISIGKEFSKVRGQGLVH
ncbi:pro-Pol polyprotein [Nephila pilipes]|uniref:Pro-Pol polyprotein n=1 Tax=Nephila pilipes TaxID=299642 RepID=A0A8X6TW37_NEPPI|nr:pro-Pol polyprotein [Nephila pilipes]